LNILIVFILFFLPYLMLLHGFKKSFLYPACLFCFVFMLTLTLAYGAIFLFGFYPISYETMAVYGAGNISFIIGALLTSKVFPEKRNNSVVNNYKYLKVIFMIVLVFLIFYSPVLYKEFIQATPPMSFSLRILRIRERGLTEQVYSTLSNNLIILSTFLIMLGAYLYSKSKLNIVFLILAYITFASYNFITGTRAAIILISLACVFVYVINTQKISKLFIFSGLIVTFLLGAFVAIFMGKDGMDRNQGIDKNLGKVVENYFSYTVQGVILFDNYLIQEKSGVAPNWDILSGTKEVVNKVSATQVFDVNTKFSDFSYFSKDKTGNVYTIYFSVYPLYGFTGVLIFFLFYGAFCAFIYERNKGVWTVFLCYLNATLCLNIFNEQIFTNMIFTLKLMAFIFCLRWVERIK